MSNYNVLIGNRICRVLNKELPAYTWELNPSKDELKGSFNALDGTGFRGHMIISLNCFLTHYKSWIRNPLFAAEQGNWVSSYATEMEILRQDFLVNGWEA